MNAIGSLFNHNLHLNLVYPLFRSFSSRKHIIISSIKQTYVR